ncbi:hypothetical protein MHU86_7757 [Fragilaria crotonensis]|nr:hypothetical protein MHU86_7757 [Fragilaria crotonensis]
MARPSEILKCPGELLHLAIASSGSDYVYAINTVRDNGTLISQKRVIKSVTIPEDLLVRIDMIPDDMYIKNVSIGPDGEWFLHYADLNGTGDKAFWDVTNSLCAEFLQARFRSGDVADFIVAFGPNLSYIILDGDRGFVMSKNVPADLRARVMSIRQTKGGVVYALSLFPNGGFFIRDSEGIAFAGSPPTLTAEFDEAGVKGVLNVHVASDYSWVVLRRNSLATCGVCTLLQREFQAHYERQMEYRKTRALEIQAFDAYGETPRSPKATKETQRRPTEKDKSLAAMKKKLLVRRITIAADKGLKPGVAVTVAGFSCEPGDCTIEGVNGEGIMTVAKTSEVSRPLNVDDPRRLSVYYSDGSPRMEVVKLLKATDKFEAAVVSLPCPRCNKKICCCQGTEFSNNQSTMFSRSSDNTPATKDMTDYDWDFSAKNSFGSAGSSWDGPSEQSDAESEGPLSTARSLHADEVMSILARNKPLRQHGVHFLPVFESKGERLSYDEFRCAEKVDFARLHRVLKDLKKDRAVRRSCADTLAIRKSNTADPNAKLHAFYLRKLKNCHELELTAEALFNALKDYPVAEDGSVVHEVEYHHKDEFFRGALFAVGKNVVVDARRYPRNTTLQAMPFELLPCLCGAFGHYIEIENSIARILSSVAQQLDLEKMIPTLLEYRDNYHSWTTKLASFHKISEDAARKWPNIIMMGEIFVYKSWLRSEGVAGVESDEIKFALTLAVEVAILSDEILRHRKFRWATADRAKLVAEGMSPAHVRATMFTRVIQSCQSDILSHVQRCCHNLGWLARSKAFDSLILEKGRDAKSSLSDALKMCQTSCVMQGWDLKLVEIPMHGLQDNSIKAIQDARLVIAQLSKAMSQSK